MIELILLVPSVQLEMQPKIEVAMNHVNTVYGQARPWGETNEAAASGPNVEGASDFGPKFFFFIWD